MGETEAIDKARKKDLIAVHGYSGFFPTQALALLPGLFGLRTMPPASHILESDEWPCSIGGTDFLVRVFGLGVSPGPPLGLLEPATDILAFGLDPTQESPPKVDLPDVLEYAGLHEIANSHIVKPLAGIKLTLTPKASNGARNATRFDPTDGCKAVIRLQFTGDNSDTVKAYMNSLTDFKLKNVNVIAKKSLSTDYEDDGYCGIDRGGGDAGRGL